MGVSVLLNSRIPEEEVRQGAVLSPVSFTIYVNDVKMPLSASGYGCYFHGTFL